MTIIKKIIVIDYQIKRWSIIKRLKAHLCVYHPVTEIRVEQLQQRVDGGGLEGHGQDRHQGGLVERGHQQPVGQPQRHEQLYIFIWDFIVYKIRKIIMIWDRSFLLLLPGDFFTFNSFMNITNRIELFSNYQGWLVERGHRMRATAS